MRCGWIFLIPILLLSYPVSAWDFDLPMFGDARFFGTNYTYFERNQTELAPDPAPGEPDEYYKLKNLLSLNLSGQNLTLGLEVRYLNWSDEERIDRQDLDRTGDDVELRKYFLEFLGDWLQVRAGTFYSSFGHGLSLYVQKNDALGFDEPLRGGTATLVLGPIELTGLGGLVTDPMLEVQYDREFEDEIYGGRLVANLPMGFFLGGSYVAAELDSTFQADLEESVNTWTVEGGVLGLAGVVDVQGEWAVVDREDSFLGSEGHGGYLAVATTLGPITLLGEMKDYWNFAYRYNNPPTAGRTNEVYAHEDVKGKRIKLDYDLGNGTLVFGSYGRFDSHRNQYSLGGIEGDERAEWYVGIEESTDRIYLESTYWRRDWSQQEIKESRLSNDLHVYVGDRHDFNLYYEVFVEETPFFERREHKSYLSYTFSPMLSGTVRYAWDEISGEEPEEFWAYEAELTPWPRLTVGLFYGETPGGLVCSGGQCRQESPFEGWKAEVTVRI